MNYSEQKKSNSVNVENPSAAWMTNKTMNSKKTSYVYDIAGRKRTIIYLSGKRVAETMNLRNQLTQVSAGNAIVANMTYNSTWQMLSRSYGNGIYTQFDYNAKAWLSSINDGTTIKLPGI